MVNESDGLNEMNRFGKLATEIKIDKIYSVFCIIWIKATVLISFLELKINKYYITTIKNVLSHTLRTSCFY